MPNTTGLVVTEADVKGQPRECEGCQPLRLCPLLMAEFPTGGSLLVGYCSSFKKARARVPRSYSTSLWTKLAVLRPTPYTQSSDQSGNYYPLSDGGGAAKASFWDGRAQRAVIIHANMRSGKMGARTFDRT